MTGLFAITALLYLVSSALYLLFLWRGDPRVAQGGIGVLAVGVLAHLGFLVGEMLVMGAHPLTDIHQALALASWLLSVGYLGMVRNRPRLRVLGAFITPVTLLFFLGAAVRHGVADVGDRFRSIMLPFHITANVLGLTAFALAFGVALAYVIQERQLRAKRLGGVFQRLPPLDVLDDLGFRLVLIGFPLFTAGVVTGSFWAIRAPGPTLDPTQTVGLAAWFIFAGVLFLRVAAGWRGRRAALGTIIGFAGACIALMGYVVRGFGSL